jgi:hypothetical protein
MSDDYGSSDRKQSLDNSAQPQPRTNRVSVQTTNTEAPTESTLSPYASPTTSSFAGQGLAPRPPSFPYGGKDSQYPPELLEKRQRRRSRRSDEYEDLGPAPPAAPDVPKAPPVSYRQPYGNGGPPLPYSAAGSSRQPRQRPAAIDDMDPEEYYKDAPPARGQGLPVLDRAQKSLDRSTSTRARGGDGEPGRRTSTNGKEREVIGAPVDSRKASAGSQSRRGGKFADDRSPLQRLELTLDSITKEEKRARVEAAEARAIDKAPSQTQGDKSTSQQVRFRDRGPPADAENGRKPVRVVATGRAQAIDTHKGPLSQNPPEEGRKYGSGSLQPRAPPQESKRAGDAKSDVPQRNLSFRERAAKNDLKLPNGFDQGSPTSPPVTTPTGGISLTRTGSNKLRKDPPGDPWFNKRIEAERKFPTVSKHPSGEPGNAGGAAVPRSTAGSVRDKALPPVPPSGESRKPSAPGRTAAAAALAAREFEAVKRRTTEPSQPKPNRHEEVMRQAGYHTPPSGRDITPKPGAGNGATVAQGARRRDRDDDSSSEDWSGSEHHHHVSKRLYRARDGLKPGEGMYNPPKFLDEWRKGTIGTLSGALLDLSEEHLPSIDKDKTWWEGHGRGKGSISSRPRKAEAFDGEYDETNGKLPSPLEMLAISR